jgi:hypothetical protein
MAHEVRLLHKTRTEITFNLENRKGKVFVVQDKITLPEVIFSGTEYEADIFISGFMAAERISTNDFLHIEDIYPIEDRK